jgi:hypothetical protein
MAEVTTHFNESPDRTIQFMQSSEELQSISTGLFRSDRYTTEGQT